ncbi:MAG: MFS transporter [Clostridia bacterium]|nr:MFS transporter [Clostridia bacterium]
MSPEVSENNNSVSQMPENRKYVKNGRLLSYAVGLGGQNVSYGFISQWLFYYLTTVLGVNSKIVGLMTSVTRTWDSINDPIVGALVDRHRFKNGEKLRPYLLSTPPVIGILSALMFIKTGSNIKASIVIVFACYLLWDLFYSFQDVALWGMVALSSPHSEERAKVSQWVTIGAGAGSTLVMAFQILRSVMSGSLGMDDFKIFAFFGLLFGLGGELISMSAYRMREAVDVPRSKESLLEAIFVLRHNKTLLLISAARFFKDAFGTMLPWAYFFESRQSFNFGFASFDGGTSQVVYSVLMGIPGALSMFFATKVSDKVGGMKRILIIAQTTAIVLRTVCYFIGFDSLGSIYAVILLMAIVAIPTNMMDIAHRSLTSDSIDEVELKTGKRTEGISFSIQNFISKISSAANSLISGYILSWLKYDNTKKNFLQGSLYMKWQWPIFIAGPIIGEILYLIVIAFVRDDPEVRARVEAELFERRKALEEKLSEV